MADRKRIGPEEDAILGSWRIFAKRDLETPEEEWDREFYVKVNNRLVHIQDLLRRRPFIEKPGWVEELETLADELEALFGEDDDDAPPDATWSAFLASHPELTARTYLPRLELDDDRVVAAVAAACEQSQAYMKEHHPDIRLRPGASAHSLANVLHGRAPFGLWEPGDACVAPGDVIRVGQCLGRLARDGRILLVSKPYESRRYAPLEVGDA